MQDPTRSILAVPSFDHSLERGKFEMHSCQNWPALGEEDLADSSRSLPVDEGAPEAPGMRKLALWHDTFRASSGSGPLIHQVFAGPEQLAGTT